MLTGIEEHTGILAAEVGTGAGCKYIPDTIVSMNCWGFTPALFAGLDASVFSVRFESTRREDELADLINQWYRVHLAAGGAPDLVQEDLIGEVRAEDAAGQRAQRNRLAHDGDEEQAGEQQVVDEALGAVPYRAVQRRVAADRVAAQDQHEVGQQQEDIRHGQTARGGGTGVADASPAS